ncbi:MAG TPA: DUF1059 domain-containing protein [Arachnia sp.]|nr:DUF1059 domain-containing protein [Arachnia sp.]
MARKAVDCRTLPNEVGCTLAMSGEAEELLEAAVVHAVTRHHETDSAELRSWLESTMVDEAPAAT